MNAAQAVGLNLCQMIVGLCVVVPVVLGPQDHGAIRRCCVAARGVSRARQLRDLPVALVHRCGSSPTGSNWPLFHGNWVVVFALALPIVVFAASVSWFGLERPVLRFVHRVAARAPATGRNGHARPADVTCT